MPAWISAEQIHGPIPAADYNGLQVWGSYASALLIQSPFVPKGYVAVVASGGPDSDRQPCWFPAALQHCLPRSSAYPRPRSVSAAGQLLLLAGLALVYATVVLRSFARSRRAPPTRRRQFRCSRRGHDNEPQRSAAVRQWATRHYRGRTVQRAAAKAAYAAPHAACTQGTLNLASALASWRRATTADRHLRAASTCPKPHQYDENGRQKPIPHGQARGLPRRADCAVMRRGWSGVGCFNWCYSAEHSVPLRPPNSGQGGVG